jgi:hypothetical protein
VQEAVTRFVDGLNPEGADAVTAAAAVTLAQKLDACRASEAAAAASAAPAIARELSALMNQLAALALKRTPSPLDEIIRRRDERLAAQGLTDWPGRRS